MIRLADVIDVIEFDGDALDEDAYALAGGADKVVASADLLALLPAEFAARRCEWPKSPPEFDELFTARATTRIVVLAKPSQPGIAATLAERFGPDQVRKLSGDDPSRVVEALGTSPGLPDEVFDHDGLVTKWEVRAIALASLRPRPGEMMWDLGAGAGSVGIEWVLHHPSCQAVAVERNPVRAQRITTNALNLGALNISVHVGSSIDLIDTFPDPDAVFIGGGLSTRLLDKAFARLPLGGRLVAHTVTLDSEALLVAARSRYGGELRRISVERADQLGSYLSWTPARAVTHWAVTKS